MDKMAPKEIAAMFSVKRPLVYRILKDFRTKSGYYEALEDKEKKAENKTEATVGVIKSFINRGQHIWRRSQLQDEIKRDHGLMIPEAFISRVLREHFGMRYKKLQLVAF